jgi:F-box/leucine-rich repeat protein 10/11
MCPITVFFVLYRFPFFTELLWYVLDRNIHCLTGKTHMDLPAEEKRRIRLEKGENIDPNQEVLKIGGDGNGLVIPEEHVHLSQSELHGLKFIIMYLHHLASSKKNVPMMLPDPISVVKDIRAIVLKHKDDCPDQAVTGKYVLRWSENDDIKPRVRKFNTLITPGSKSSSGARPSSEMSRHNAAASAARRKAADRLRIYKKSPAGNRRRRVRCKNCEACMGGDCRMCVYCRDMIKYGGPGRMKQTCEKRRCLHPQLPICAFCSVCELDGWNNVPKAGSKESERPEEPPNLFECTVCLDIVHPKCAEKTVGLGKVNPGKLKK